MTQSSNRYPLESFIGPLQSGRLYKGKDKTLQRPVLIHEIPLIGPDDSGEYLQTIGSHSSGAKHPLFMELLDVEVRHQSLRLIIHYRKGVSLAHHLEEATLPFPEAVHLVFELGQSLLDVSAEGRTPEFSLDPENLWLTDEGDIQVVNGWERSERPEAAAKSLCRLLFLLISRHGREPAKAELLLAHFWPHLQSFAANDKEAFVSAVTKAWEGNISVAAFTRILGALIGRKPRVVAPATPPPAAAEPSRTAPSKRRSDESRQPADEPKRSAAAALHVDDDDDEYDDEAESDDDDLPRGKRWVRFSKRLLLGLTFTAIGLAVCIGVLIAMIGMNDRKQSEETAPPVESVGSSGSVQTDGNGAGNDSESGEEAAEGNSGEEGSNDTSSGSGSNGNASTGSGSTGSQSGTPPSNGSSGGPNSSGETVEVPTPQLIGLALKDAEKLAIDSGLRYEFFLETHEEEEGTVFKQEPAAGETVAKGTRVTFWVSKGP